MSSSRPKTPFPGRWNLAPVGQGPPAASTSLTVLRSTAWGSVHVHPSAGPQKAGWGHHELFPSPPARLSLFSHPVTPPQGSSTAGAGAYLGADVQSLRLCNQITGEFKIKKVPFFYHSSKKVRTCQQLSLGQMHSGGPSPEAGLAAPAVAGLEAPRFRTGSPSVRLNYFYKQQPCL